MSDVTIPEKSQITSVPGWCPPDVEAIALQCLEDWFAFDKPVIARRIACAILAEREAMRERCAKIAEGVAASYSRRRESEPRGSDDAWQSASMSVAAVHVSRAIRSPHE